MHGLKEKEAQEQATAPREEVSVPQGVAELREQFEKKEAKRKERARQRELRAEAKQEVQRARRSRKLQTSQEKQEYRRRRRQSKDRRWFSFFTKWFFIGLGLIAVSIGITLILQPQDKLEKGISLLSGLLSTVGIALLVGAIFDFSKNSEAFIKFVTSILSDIIMSKTFLTTLSD